METPFTAEHDATGGWTMRIQGPAKWALIVGAWTFFGLLLTSQAYVAARMRGGSVPFGRALLTHMPWAYAWALFTPGVLWLRRRFPFERGFWRKSLFLHIVASLLLALLGDVVFVASGQLAGRVPAEAGTLVDRSLLTFVLYFHMDPFIYWVILGLSYAAQHYRESRERQLRASQLETQLARARLRALEMQLRPHFLFNALNTVAVLVRTGQSELAVKVITQLAALLRRALDGSRAQIVPLRQELDFIQRYLDIEQVRFGDRLKVSLDVAPDTLEAAVPYLILQPLVENAIRHGIGPKVTAEHLEIRARRSDGHLRLEVRDTGPGLPPDWKGDEREGVGLSTTRARLRQLYGDDQLLELRDADDSGVTATLTIPYRRSTEAVPEGRS